MRLRALVLLCLAACGDDAPAGSPADGTPVSLAVSLSAGSDHTCALDAAGTLRCWGDNADGELGTAAAVGAVQSCATRAAELVWSSIAAGADFTCGVRLGGSLWCWGQNSEAQLGVGDRDDRTAPAALDTACEGGTLGAVRHVSTAGYHACAVLADGTLRCWGQNTNGRVGASGAACAGPVSTVLRPALVEGGAPWAWVEAGGDVTCGLRTDGSLWCWGSNDSGQLGVGDELLDETDVPLEVAPGTRWRTVSASTFHACGIQESGSLWCWGSNGTDQLGVPAVTRSYAPLQVGADLDWSSVSAGPFHTCATKSTGALWCWGSNGNGQTGIPNEAEATEPRLVPGGGSYTKLTSGIDHGCAERAGSIVCWGDNTNGLLGVGVEDSGQAGPTTVCVAE